MPFASLHVSSVAEVIVVVVGGRARKVAAAQRGHLKAPCLCSTSDVIKLRTVDAIQKQHRPMRGASSIASDQQPARCPGPNEESGGKDARRPTECGHVLLALLWRPPVDVHDLEVAAVAVMVRQTGLFLKAMCRHHTYNCAEGQQASSGEEEVDRGVREDGHAIAARNSMHPQRRPDATGDKSDLGAAARLVR